jgi:DNA-binding GntR family transcriptional regulator
MVSVPVGKAIPVPPVTESQDRARARELTSDPRLWVQFKNLVSQQIADGVLEPGDEIAPTLEAADFGISWTTAIRALRELVAEGLLLPPPYRGAHYTVAEVG